MLSRSTKAIKKEKVFFKVWGEIEEGTLLFGNEGDECDYFYNIICMKNAKSRTDNRETRELHDGSALLHP